MNHSLVTADSATHLKIVVVALIGAILVVGVGIGARAAGATTWVGRQWGPVLKAADPAVYTSHSGSFVR
jgi:hypothetical protein